MKLKDLLEGTDPYLTKQKKDYDCGVATTYTILDYFDLDSDNYLEVQEELKTKKATGTQPQDIEKILKDYGVVESANGNVGYVLLNVEDLYDDHPEDGQNGHWSFIQYVNGEPFLFDVWTGKSVNYKTMDNILKYTKNIKVGDSIYNDYYKLVGLKKCNK